MTDNEIMQALREPFPAEDVGWLPGATTKDKSKALALAYIDARVVMDRLDAVMGIGGWQATYEMTTDGCWCHLALNLPGGWLTKTDMGDAGDVGGAKSAVSNALKRAAVQWGIGRYLYSVEGIWVDYDDQRKRFKTTPTLPPKFLPRPKGNGKPPPEKEESARAALEIAEWKAWLKTAGTLERFNQGIKDSFPQIRTETARKAVWSLILDLARERDWEFDRESKAFEEVQETAV